MSTKIGSQRCGVLLFQVWYAQWKHWSQLSSTLQTSQGLRLGGSQRVFHRSWKCIFNTSGGYFGYISHVQKYTCHISYNTCAPLSNMSVLTHEPIEPAYRRVPWEKKTLASARGKVGMWFKLFFQSHIWILSKSCRIQNERSPKTHISLNTNDNLQIEPAIWQYAADFRSPFAGYHSPPQIFPNFPSWKPISCGLIHPHLPPEEWKKNMCFWVVLSGWLYYPLVYITYNCYDSW